MARRWMTLINVLFAPRHFFKTLAIHGRIRNSFNFSMCVTVGIFMISYATFFVHLGTLSYLRLIPYFAIKHWWIAFALIPLILMGVQLLLYLVAWLTAIECRFWGYRMTWPIAARALSYLSPHAIVAVLPASVVVFTYRVLVSKDDFYRLNVMFYLYTLCVVVTAGAVYLFVIYWIAMKSILLANRVEGSEI